MSLLPEGALQAKLLRRADACLLPDLLPLVGIGDKLVSQFQYVAHINNICVYLFGVWLKSSTGLAHVT